MGLVVVAADVMAGITVVCGVNRVVVLPAGVVVITVVVVTQNQGLKPKVLVVAVRNICSHFGVSAGIAVIMVVNLTPLAEPQKKKLPQW